MKLQNENVDRRGKIESFPRWLNNVLNDRVTLTRNIKKMKLIANQEVKVMLQNWCKNIC